MDTPPPVVDKVPLNPNSSADSPKLEVDVVPRKGDLNRTSYCLPAQPVVTQTSPPPNLMFDGGDNSETFLGWEGRCHSPQYSCSSPTQLDDHNPKETNSPLDPEVEEGKVLNESHCVMPRLVRDLKRFRIVQIQRRQDVPKPPVLFVGNVMDLYDGLKSTNFVPRSWFLSSLFGFSGFSKLPEKLETVLLLTAGLSAGLAVVNMLPIYGLDGYHIVDSMARAYFTKKWEPRQISRLVQYISWIALAIAFLTIFCSLAQAL